MQFLKSIMDKNKDKINFHITDNIFILNLKIVES